MQKQRQRRGARIWVAATIVLASCGAPEPTARRDAGPDGDAGAVLNGCAEGMFVDRAGSGADRTVGFGGAGGSGPFEFAPRCIAVAAGQSVTFTGAFSRHPLSPGVNPANLTAGSPNNPVPRTSTGDTLVVTFPSAGDYPFFCEMHHPAGMRGVVRVR